MGHTTFVDASECDWRRLNMIDFFGQMEAHSADKAVLAFIIAFGVFEVFFGLRFFRLTLFIMSACATFVVVTSVSSDHIDNDNKVYVLSGACALLVGLVASYKAKLGAAILGLALGGASSYILHISLLQNSNSPKWLFYGIVAAGGLVGSFIGYKGFRLVIILATTIGGSFLTIRSIDMWTKNELSVDAVQNHTLSSEGWGLLVAFGFLFLAGFIVQNRSSHTVPSSVSGASSRSKQQANRQNLLEFENDDRER